MRRARGTLSTHGLHWSALVSTILGMVGLDEKVANVLVRDCGADGSRYPRHQR